MRIGGLQRFSLIDFPKKISAIIFTQGCNFRCPYCHNPELVCPSCFEKAIPDEDVFAFLRQRIGKLDAISITGGEPTLQADLVSFCRQVKAMGFLVKLDTNGTKPAVIQALLDENLLDYIAMDLKGPTEKYDEIVRAKINTSDILKSVSIIKNSGIKFEFRTTLVQFLLDEEDVYQLRKDFGPLKRYFLQRFIPSKTLDDSFMEEITFTDESLDRIALNFHNCNEFAIR